ncbi:hypothetical protein [Flavobacterium aquidurense]|uniref:Uncharacterized protein n=1 Tax=Flavobacterium aquidurense TaxID=362413 RepID=A0A0Q0XNT5_9FLAO|nr:hypothetical protein [Flavobacterium aquidurense]KQB37439.1 hypothetical protein RC62_2605 [Flavobacterium aquidurense]
MDLKIRENDNGKYVVIYSNNFSEGIDFVFQNKISQIQLKGTVGKIEQKIDFSLIEKVSNQIKILTISNLNDTQIENLESIYNLIFLEILFVPEKLNFKLDILKFENLIQFGGVFSPKILNLNKHEKLQSLVISSGYPTENLDFLCNLKYVQKLHLYKANKLENLKGIEKLSSLFEISIGYNSKITSVLEINDSKVEKLIIEKCKNLLDFSFLKENKHIKELFIDNIKSIEFITAMPNLEIINFWDCKDGNMRPLLEAKKLKQINFYPNKKHYSHTIEEIIEITGARRGRNV